MPFSSVRNLDADAIEDFVYDVPAETIARVITIPVYLRQIHRLQSRTNSWLDRPVPLAVQALMLTVPPLVHVKLAPKLELSDPTRWELSKSLWISELSTPLLVKTNDSAPQFLTRDGRRVLVVSHKFFTRPEAVQRRLVAAADRNDTSNLTATLAAQVASLTVERLIWRAVVGDRSKLTKRRALAFVGLEIARVTAVRKVRPVLARKLDANR